MNQVANPQPQPVPLLPLPPQSRAALATGPATVLVPIEPAPVWETSDWPQGYGEWMWEYPDGSGRASGPSHYWIEHSPWKVGERVGIQEPFTLVAIPPETVRAEQLIRGPIIPDGRWEGWRYAVWFDGDEHPGGWSSTLCRLSAEWLPAWAVRTWATVRSVGVAKDEAGRWGVGVEAGEVQWLNHD